MTTEIYICLDLGSDTLKISYAYHDGNQEICGKLMRPDLVNQVALPAVAFYEPDTKTWRFAEELEAGGESNFSTVVKMKSLLSLIAQNEDKTIEERNCSYYREQFYFPQFSFPIRRKNNADFQYLVDQKLVFEAPGTTPMMLCEKFFVHIKDIITESLRTLSEATSLDFSPMKISIVYPPKQGTEYVDELSRLITVAFGIEPTKSLTSTQAIGLLAFHKGMLRRGEQALFFDMGDETISVTKASINQIESNNFASAPKMGILVDSPDGHSRPLDIGGSNIDEAIARYLEDSIHMRETVGSPSADIDGHIFENGICATQYLLMKDIKKAKMIMPISGRGMFRDGVPISIHRETLVQRLLTRDNFLNCTGIAHSDGVARDVLNYVLDELERPINRDVTKILFSGGMTETIGLIQFFKDAIGERFPRILVDSFENYTDNDNIYDIQFYEASTYAASLGGAIINMHNYSVDPVMSFSYGTWLYHGDNREHLKLFANRGDILANDQNVFSIEAVLELRREECVSLNGDEMFSTIITTQEIEAMRYHDALVYENGWLIIGTAGSYERSLAEKIIDLKVVAGGASTEIQFYHNGERVALSNRHPTLLHFEEGFVVDKNGHAVPFFKNSKEKNNIMVLARNINTNKTQTLSASEIEFRLTMKSITVATST